MKDEQRFRWLTVVVWGAVACLLVLVVLLALLFFARAGRGGPATPPAVSILAPAHGARFGVGATTTVHVQAAAPGEPLARLQLWADGQLAGDIPASGALAEALWNWTPRTPGDHTLLAQAYTRDGASDTVSVRVVAVEEADGDGDGVPDAEDACPDRPGPLQAQGCPTNTPTDRDGDGVADAQDRCPDEFGLAANDGCPLPPDRDGDGIADGEDGCPDQAGPPDGQGCPAPAGNDQDGDGVVNNEDSCDDQPGPAGNLGCPGASGDRDGDGLPDDQDACPDVAGVLDNGGCPLPDADDPEGDGVVGDEDQCPGLPGPAGHDGCPSWGGAGTIERRGVCDLLRLLGRATPACTDSDGDGVMDADDRCPQEAGPALLGGCAQLAGGGALARGGPSVLQCRLFPSLCTDSDGDGAVDAEDGCPTLPGDILGCPAFGESGGEAVGPSTDVQLRLGERLYTHQDWMSVYCYVEVEDLPPSRLPWDRHSLEREAPFVWNLGDRRSVDLTTDEVVLSLSLRCFGMPDRIGPEVYLGRVARDHPREDWDGRTREAVSAGGADTFTVYYRICQGDCD